MIKIKFIILPTTLLLFSVSVFAADNVVVVPLGKSDPNLTPENICSGITILGVTGERNCLPPNTVISASRIWMDRNLGASRVATGPRDSEAYGDLYQWGRPTDGHEKRTSSTTDILSSTDVPGHGEFILTKTSPYDWRDPQNDNLWQGVSGINNPCPPGFRLPTDSEWETERSSWISNDSAGAFASPLKLVVGGYRSGVDGTVSNSDTIGVYWSSAVGGTFGLSLAFDGDAGIWSDFRARGFSVRCTMD